MPGRPSLLAALTLSLVSLPAEAESEPECQTPGYVWELELTRVESTSPDIDLSEVARALGTRARMRGGYRDPARSRATVRAQLVGSTDGTGLMLLLEKTEP